MSGTAAPLSLVTPEAACGEEGGLTHPTGAREDSHDVAVEADGALPTGSPAASAKGDEDADDDDVCGPSFFEEEVQCRELLQQLAALLPSSRLPEGVTASPTTTATAASQLLPSVGQEPAGPAGVVQRLEKIMDRYQECPHLLYPYLEDLVTPLVGLLLRYLPPAPEVWAYEAFIRQQQQQQQQQSSALAEGPGRATGPAAGGMLGRNYDLFDADAPRTAVHLVCQALYSVVKTTGAQACTSHFPNDVCHYEDVFYALRLWKNTDDGDDAAAGADGEGGLAWASVRQREWQVRYCLLLWLCNLVLVPFSLATIDSTAAAGPAVEVAAEGRIAHADSLSDAVLVTAVALLADSTKCRDGAALLVARLLTRPDSQRHRQAFFDYARALVDAAVARAGAGRTAETAAEPCRELNFLTRALAADGDAHPTLRARRALHESVVVPGVLEATAAALKLGQRREMLPYAAALIPGVARLLRLRVTDTLLCKTAVKVIQRLVLTMLRKTSAGWKYARRDVSSLAANLGATTTADGGGEGSVEDPDGATDDADVLEGDQDALEEGIGLLLETVTHKDTIVRWSSAKGLGLVCSRLPGDVGSEVVEAVFECFEQDVNDAAWHGGLLALAEMCRRSIITPATLGRVVGKIAVGLRFDVSRGTYSVGAHVRDAACYACWSLARAYDAVDLAAHVQTLSGALVVTALFDREVSVRRAAAAAFQECVGRLGSFPDGIELVTTMDFFSLASRNRAYLNVAPKVAVHDAYRGAMLKELVGRKLLHWDRAVRECAAGALGKVAAIAFAQAEACSGGDSVTNVRAALDAIVDELQRRVVDAAVATRHGAVLGLAELVRGGLPASYWSEPQRTRLADVVVRIDQARLFRSRGGEHIRAACCVLLSACAQVALPLPEYVLTTRMSGGTVKARTRGKWQEFLEATWANILEWLQQMAADTFAQVARTYDTTYQPVFHGKVMTKMLDATKVGGVVDTTTPLERRGVLAAMGGLPTPLLVALQVSEGEGEGGVPFFVPVLHHLGAAAVAGVAEPTGDAESRRNAVRALASVLLAVPLDHPELTPALYQQLLLGAVLAGLADYAVDKRGDVGSFVRLAALQALPSVLRVGLRRPELLVTGAAETSIPVRVLQGVVRVSLEKLDRVRGAAVAALADLLLPSPDAATRREPMLGGALTDLVEVAETRYLQSRLQGLLLAGEHATDTTSPVRVLGALAAPLLLHTPHVYAGPAMEGLVLAAGDRSLHVQRPGMQAMLAAFRGEGGEGGEEEEGCAAVGLAGSAEAMERLSTLVVGVGLRYPHSERVLTPLSRVLDRLLNADLLSVSVHEDCVRLLQSELRHFATAITVLLPLVSLLATLCRSSDRTARQAAWSLAMEVITSRYPKVRARMAADLYTALLMLTSAAEGDGARGEDGEGLAGCRAAMDLLLRVQWDVPDVDVVRTARAELSEMLGLPLPATGSDLGEVDMDAAGVRRPVRARVAGSYAALVREAGY